MILIPGVELVAQLARLVRLAEQAENRARAAQRAAQRGRAVSARAVREHARVQLVVRIAVFIGQQLDNRRHSARAAAAVRVEALIAMLHNRILVQLLIRPRPGRRFHALGQLAGLHVDAQLASPERCSALPRPARPCRPVSKTHDETYSHSFSCSSCFLSRFNRRLTCAFETILSFLFSLNKSFHRIYTKINPNSRKGIGLIA